MIKFDIERQYFIVGAVTLGLCFNFAFHPPKEGIVMTVLKVMLLAIVIMGLVFAGLAIQMLLKKGGKFPNTHVGSNKYLKSKGVTCAQTDDKMEQAKARKELRYKKISPDNNEK